MADTSPPPVPSALPQGAGYGICVGLGAFFGLTMWYITKLLARHLKEIQGSEMFMTAKRSINTGLIASAVVSSWTIAATLLTSSTWTYSYGVSGAYFYGKHFTITFYQYKTQPIELKRKAPGAHTFLERSAVFTALTGMNVIAGCFLLPIGVVIYTMTGGIKATFLVDYTHTVIIYIIVLVALFTAYANSPLIGSPDRMYDLLREAAQIAPVSGNSQGEYLTMKSLSGVILGIVIFTTGWSAAVDVQLFQKAIAANSSNTLGGYMLGGICWFSVPFCLATTFGLVARALQNNAAFPTYPRVMTTSEVNAGLAMPFAAQALLGKGGAVAVLLMIFMAVTSAFSSDLVCIASVVTYDVYRSYVNPRATGKQLLRLSHVVVVLFALFCACIAAGLSQTAIGVNFIVTSIGIICAPAIFPIASTVLWRKQNTVAVVLAPLLGTATGISCWLGSTHHWYHSITIETLGDPLPLVVGNATSLISPIIYGPLLTYLFGPQNFDWGKFRQNIHVVDDSDVAGITADQLVEQRAENEISADENRSMKRARFTAAVASIAVTLAFIIVFPMPLYGTGYVFSKVFFRFWVVWTFLWAWAAALIITLLPLWQGRRTLRYIFVRMLGRGKGVGDDSSSESELSEGVPEIVELEKKLTRD
ncbi:hypothetical protein NM688_g8991 [Phlebia brevispora]|uniref:Uncharacterized protein n=1 Tax=Phlebia brevispora TaxID=194682 RepID=A0ACC1RN88_9APHY|nr:hypothetical protein NM688_g8991 [Phlebia brevispora]